MYLVFVGPFRTVVTSITNAVTISVLLIGVGDLWTVVPLVENSVIVHVRIASVTESVSIGILLVQVGQEGAVVAGVTPLVVTILLSVQLESISSNVIQTELIS